MEPRVIAPADLPVILSMNNAEVPHVGELVQSKLDKMLPMCAHALAIGDPAHAFCLTFGPDVDYWSNNYAWVSEHFDQFVYLDRVCVAPTHQRLGLATRMYHHVESHTDATWFVLEVNTRPLNQHSLDFHAALGFHEVGRANPYGNDDEVAYLAKQI